MFPHRQATKLSYLCGTMCHSDGLRPNSFSYSMRPTQRLFNDKKDGKALLSYTDIARYSKPRQKNGLPGLVSIPISPQNSKRDAKSGMIRVL
jgi:hypothetical protein